MERAPTGAGEEAEEAIPISALQHWLFCPRQCALIHVEQLWAENALTAEGRIAHETVHAQKAERRRGVRTVTGMPLRSARLRLVGVADVVELRDVGGRLAPFPVEHKRGRPKAHRADEVQLCAQGLCLEEMFGACVPGGALFYGESRRRQEVSFDAELRRLTEKAALTVRALLDEGRTPLAVYEPKRCDSCSLLELCRPKALQRPRPVLPWLARLIEEA